VNIDEPLGPVGVLFVSKPVIASNVLVFPAAAWTLARNPDGNLNGDASHNP
jgi:hypothetical protein